jgi:hypothetical protein
VLSVDDKSLCGIQVAWFMYDVLTTEEEMMRDINISIEGIDLNYQTACAMANSVASMIENKPIIMAWHDKPHGKMGTDIPGGDLNTRWHDYGENYGGNLDVSVNGD